MVFLDNVYYLSSEELNCFEETVRKNLIMGKKPACGQPIGIFTGGQPGSGKTVLVKQTVNEFKKQNKDIVVIDLDKQRKFLPNKEELAKQNFNNYLTITNKYVGKTIEKITTELILKSYNFIFETTLGTNTYSIDKIIELNLPYKIVVKVLAVSREESLLSIFERCLKKNSTSLFISIAEHDKRYYNLINILRNLETRNIEIEVYERGLNEERCRSIYKSSQFNNKYTSASDALIAGRFHSKEQCLKNSTKRIDAIYHSLILKNSEKLLLDEFLKLNEIFKK